MVILECQDLEKRLGKKEILKKVNLKVEEKDILAFIGPNGAGKTTTIKLILGLQNINGGKVIINGYDIEKDYVKAISKVGSIVENPEFYMYLTGYDNLKLVANMYPNVKKDRIDEVVKIVGLENRINDKVSKYSLGMRQRLGIARSLLAKPNLLILDEPTNGLDPEGIKDLRNLLKKLAAEGMGILISSHNLAELESFCNKVCIINNGMVIETNDVKKLKHLNNNIYSFSVNDTRNLKIENMENVTDTSFILKTSRENIPKIIEKLIQDKVLIYEVKEIEMSLEEAFLLKAGGNKID